MNPMHALLIGIDHYAPNDYCTSLKGAVADVEAMAEHLRQTGVPPEQIRYLMSRSPLSPGAEDPTGERPTYEAMVLALKDLTARAAAGEQVVIYYSGHGGRTRTLIPASKGVEGIDEGFVPPDIGHPEARYLRDLELAYLVDAMTEKGLLVTLIIDACHSGGMLRGHPGLIRRGCRQVDPTQRLQESLVASPEELERTWCRLSERTYSTTRGRRGSEWLPGTRGFVLLAACSCVESAYELPLAGGIRGLLTHSLLSILAEGGSDLSWRQVHDRLVGRVHRYASIQTPVLEGEVSRSVFGGGLKSLIDGLNVVEVAPGGLRVKIGGGQAMGLLKGALLRLFPAGTPPEPTVSPEVEIEECGPVDSWAVVLQDRVDPSTRIRPGDRAVLIDPGESYRRPVAWLPGSVRGAQASPLATPAAGPSHRFLETVGDTEPADFQVVLNGAGEYEIRHCDGTAVADMPRVPAGREGSASQVVDLLAHLAKFYNVRDLENRDRSSPLREAILLEVGWLEEDFKLGQKLDPKAFEPGSVPQVKAGTWICLSITNLSLQALQIYVLDLQPGWSIEQVYPQSGLETLEGGQTLHRPLEVYVPPHLDGRHEILKVFATADAADFRWLSLPPVGQHPFRSALGAPQGPLERLFAEIAQDGPKMRTVRSDYASRHWTSAQVEFEVVVMGGGSTGSAAPPRSLSSR